MRRELADTRQKIDTPKGKAWIFNTLKLKERGYDVERLPYSVKVLLENALRHSGRVGGAEEAVERLADWGKEAGGELPLMPFRVLLQDYTGVPLVVDLAAMRDAAAATGLSPKLVNSKIPVDLIIDHSIQVDAWSSEGAFETNLEREYERNSERYSLLKWAQTAFNGMRVFPPGKGICHQVNLEYLSKVVATSGAGDVLQAFPDSVLGTDSHTTMVNGLGVLGWGVGGIEAEAVMLGEPYHMPIPQVLGVELKGSLREGVTPTDMVLAVTEKLREKNVVGKFVEFFGDGYTLLSVPDRATLGNMSPEYGATMGFCPVDEATLTYLSGTGREKSHIEFVKKYTTQTGLFLSNVIPRYSDVLVIELDRVESSIAGPRNPEERRSLATVPYFARELLAGHRSTSSQRAAIPTVIESGAQVMLRQPPTAEEGLDDGAVVIAAITSCTNTSNPTVMVGAGLLAKKAVELGLSPKPWVKRSLAPGSVVVTDYLENSGLMPYLDKLGFNVVGYGCTTCIGNSGPLAPDIEQEIKARDLYAVAVLSGNRNFDGRINPLARGAFLMSPMLVVAYSLVGKIGFDFQKTPLGLGRNGKEVYLRDIWPTSKQVKKVVEESLSPALYHRRYAEAMKGEFRWESLAAYADDRYHWEKDSTYIVRPPWFDAAQTKTAKSAIRGARILAILDDKVTTDHISPAGTIAFDSPAGNYLSARGVKMFQFSTYGSRRGNHEVMVRGGFANIRLKNALAPGKEGGWTTHFPTRTSMPIYDAATRYSDEGVPLVVIAGKQYGAGSSRDWAAKAPKLLGVRAVIAESFERIHRSNLVAMGVLPLQFMAGENRLNLGLKGDETIEIGGISEMAGPGEKLAVVADGPSGKIRFDVTCRVDNATEMTYLEKGGVLPLVFSKLNNSVH
jgi:aconitate hydratase